MPLDTVTAYADTTPTITAGSPIIFSDNTELNGTALSHTANTGDIVFNEPGVYFAAFSGTAVPPTGTAFPSTNSIYMTLNGTRLEGATTQHIFHISTENAPESVSRIITVTAAGSRLEVVTEGDIVFNYATLSVFKIADLPANT